RSPMRRGPAGAPLLALCLAATPVTAEELPTRFEAAARVAVGIPIGNATGGTPSAPNGTSLADLVAWTVPLELELGARIGPAFVGGGVSPRGGGGGRARGGRNPPSARPARLSCRWTPR